MSRDRPPAASPLAARLTPADAEAAPAGPGGSAGADAAVADPGAGVPVGGIVDGRLGATAGHPGIDRYAVIPANLIAPNPRPVPCPDPADRHGLSGDDGGIERGGEPTGGGCECAGEVADTDALADGDGRRGADIDADGRAVRAGDTRLDMSMEHGDTAPNVDADALPGVRTSPAGSDVPLPDRRPNRVILFAGRDVRDYIRIVHGTDTRAKRAEVNDV